MKILKSKYSSSLTDEHLNDCIRVGITKYTTHYKTVEEMQCEVSHSNLFGSTTFLQQTLHTLTLNYFIKQNTLQIY